MENDRSTERFAGTAWFQDVALDGNLDLISYWRIIWTRRWTVLAIFLAIFLLVLIYTLKQAPVYRASGTLEIEMPKNPSTFYQVQLPPPENYLATQARILRSDELTSRVIVQLKLPSSPEAKSAFQERLTADVTRGTRLIQVTFEAGNPETAANVVNTLFRLYLEQLQEGWSESAESLSALLLRQLKETKEKLERSVGELQRYAQEHRLPFVDGGETSLQDPDVKRLDQLQSELTRVQSVRIAKESLYKQAQSGEMLAVQDTALNGLQQKEVDLRHQETELSATFGPQYPKVRQVQHEIIGVQQLQAAERLEAIKKIAAEYETALEQETRLRRVAEEHRATVEAAADQRWQYSILRREVDLNKQLYEGLLLQVQQAGLSLQWQGTNARVIDAAKPPPEPIRPRTYRNLLAGVVGGLIFAIGFVFIEEYIQSTFASSGSVEAYLNLPLLAALPDVMHTHIPSASAGENPNPTSHRLGANDNGSKRPRDGQSWFRLDVNTGKSCSDLTEALLDLRTSLLSALDSMGARTLLFTSAVPSEGKTMISSNVSIALARLGKTVLLIDGDLRLPSLHKVFSLPHDAGVADYLEGDREWPEVVCHSNMPGLDVMVCGERSSHPTELLSSDRMAALIREAKAVYDFVVVDSPTLLKIADSRILATHVDAVVLVVKSSATPKAVVKQAYASLRSISRKVVGVVLNRSELGDPLNYYSRSPYANIANKDVLQSRGH